MRPLVLALLIAGCASEHRDEPRTGSAAPRLRDRPAQLVHITMKALGIT